MKPFKITKSQLENIKEAADIMSAMLGCGEPESDKVFNRIVKSIDKMLKENGHKRDYK